MPSGRCACGAVLRHNLATGSTRFKPVVGQKWLLGVTHSNEVNELVCTAQRGVATGWWNGGANMVPSDGHPMAYHSRTYAPAFRPRAHSR
jgi:hypothetical protein